MIDESSEDEDGTTSASTNETASSDGGSSITLPSTATAPMSSTTTMTTVADTGGSSSTGEPTCAGIETESIVCMFLDEGAGYIVGMDTGTVCEHVLLESGASATSLVWIDDQLLACDGSHTAALIDVGTGAVMPLAAPCVAATLEVFPYASRIAATNDLVYGAWHSTGHLEGWDLASETRLDDLSLAGYNDWVHGLAIVDDVALVLGRGVITGYDAASGKQVLEVALDDHASPGGLACRRGG